MVNLISLSNLFFKCKSFFVFFIKVGKKNHSTITKVCHYLILFNIILFIIFFYSHIHTLIGWFLLFFSYIYNFKLNSEASKKSLLLSTKFSLYSSYNICIWRRTIKFNTICLQEKNYKKLQKNNWFKRKEIHNIKYIFFHILVVLNKSILLRT